MRIEFRLSMAIVLAWVVAPATARSINPYAEAWAAAESADQNAETCHHKSGDEAIAGCSAAIGSGKLGGIGLAIIFYGRGIEYQVQGDSARAIADYNEAIRLDRQNAGAYFNRGRIYYLQKDYARAIADYTEAIRINPNDAVSYRDRGRAKALLGESTEGDADIAHACDLNSAFCERKSR
jgi:tetratricopeptide (TPR) repeat protein